MTSPIGNATRAAGIPAESARKAPPKPNFDRLACPYRWLEYLTFGGALHRTRTRLLPRLDRCRHALVLGDGDGRFTAALLARYPHISVDAVDLSPAMLRTLSHRAHSAHPTAAQRLRTFATDALAFTPPASASYDLVVTHFFLDCLSNDEVPALCRRLHPFIEPRAAWLVSDFRIPPGALRLPARFLIRSLYFGFRVLTGLRTTRLPDYPSALADAGFSRTETHLSLGGTLTTELWRLSGPAIASHSLFQSHSLSQSQRSKLPNMLTSTLTTHFPSDPVPDPEPPSPSLPEPDPGVFHHEPGPPPPPIPAKPN